MPSAETTLLSSRLPRESSGGAEGPLAFHSILFRAAGDSPARLPREAPDFFRDLNLDQIVEAATAGFEEYDLAPFYFHRLDDLDAIAYRQEVMRDLESEALTEAVTSFSAKMRAMRECLADREKERVQRAAERLLLAAAEAYCDAVGGLSRDLASLSIESRGMLAFREHLKIYSESEPFRRLASETAALVKELAEIRYCLLLRGSGVTVRRYDAEPDYTTVIEAAFERFRRDSGKTFWVELRDRGGASMNHVQAQILDRLALLFPEAFRAQEAFSASHAGFVDGTISRFDREVQFYVSYLVHLRKLRGAGLTFCQPTLARNSREVRGVRVFDLALAARLICQKSPVVRNDFFLSGAERIFVVSGPNQGGKTTFARTFGQMHYLACLGCSVPGVQARLVLFDRLFTHFEREEKITNLRGKLQDDLVRIRAILEQATERSIVILNEAFSSTTLKDSLFLSRAVMTRLTALGAFGVWVTFLDELSSFGESTVSMVSLVDPSNPAIRTYRIERRPADGLAYALALAEKHQVTYDWVTRRIRS